MVFRNYQAPKPIPVSEMIPGSTITMGTPNSFFLKGFIKDFVVEPASRDISRGFLDGFSSMLSTAGPSSDLARAAAIVESTVLRNRHGYSNRDDHAVSEYCDLLRSFQTTLSNPGKSPSMQTLATAVLLGLYEVS